MQKSAKYLPLFFFLICQKNSHIIKITTSFISGGHTFSNHLHVISRPQPFPSEHSFFIIYELSNFF